MDEEEAPSKIKAAIERINQDPFLLAAITAIPGVGGSITQVLTGIGQQIHAVARFNVHGVATHTLAYISTTTEDGALRYSAGNLRRMPMTLARVSKSGSGSEFSVLNLQMVTRVECRNFDGE